MFNTASCVGAGVYGKRQKSVKTAFKTAVSLSNLPGKISPHTLRHTAATWLMQIGVSTWEAAGFLGMSEKTLRDVYGHHHPDYLHRAANAIGTKKPVSLVNSLVRPTRRRLQPSQPFENIGGPGSTHIQPINASPSMRWVGMNNQRYRQIYRHFWPPRYTVSPLPRRPRSCVGGGPGCCKPPPSPPAGRRQVAQAKERKA